MATDPWGEIKTGLRQKALQQRASLSGHARSSAAQRAAEHFKSGVAIPPGAVVAAYWPIRDEIDCRPLLVHLMDNGQPVCLPVVRGTDKPLELRLWEPGTPLFEAGFGTLAPAEGAPRVEPQFVIMPLLGFDRSGTRLGYGGGYYDRTLAAMAVPPVLVGYAFAAQELPDIPREPHDRPLDCLVTENGVRRFNSAPGP